MATNPRPSHKRRLDKLACVYYSLLLKLDKTQLLTTFQQNWWKTTHLIKYKGLAKLKNTITVANFSAYLRGKHSRMSGADTIFAPVKQDLHDSGQKLSVCLLNTPSESRNICSTVLLPLKKCQLVSSFFFFHEMCNSKSNSHQLEQWAYEALFFWKTHFFCQPRR